MSQRIDTTFRSCITFTSRFTHQITCRADIYNSAVWVGRGLLFTMDGKQSGSDEYRTQVNRKNFVEILYTCFCDRRKFADTDVVDNNINIVPFGKNGLHTTFKCVFITYVDLMEYSPGCLRSLLSRCFVYITKGNLISSQAKSFYYCFAYSFRSACYKYSSF